MISLITRAEQSNLIINRTYFLLDENSFKKVRIISLLDDTVGFRVQLKRQGRCIYKLHILQFLRSCVLVKPVQLYHLYVNCLVIVEWSTLRDNYFVCKVTGIGKSSFTVVDIENVNHVRTVQPQNAFHLHKFAIGTEAQLSCLDVPLSVRLSEL